LKALSPEEREQLRQVSRRGMWFTAELFGALIAVTMPLPWPVLSLGLLILAIVTAARTLPLAKANPLARGNAPFLVLGIVVASVFTVYALASVVTWPARWDYEQCLSRAQTIAGREACVAEYSDSTRALLDRLISGQR
jgi:hypothetical protein